MTMTYSAALKFLEKAISPDDLNQYEFACNVDRVAAPFPTKFISNQYFPFLALWLPKNNDKILKAISEKIDKLISIPSTFVDFAPVMESLLSSEKPEIISIIKEKIKNVTINGETFGFFEKLLASPYDFVRSFIPNLLCLTKSIEEKQKIYNELMKDSAFKVRHALCLSIPSMELQFGKNLVLNLIRDSHSRIKSLIPVVCSSQPYWLDHILPNLITDHDWAVRASLALELPKSLEPKKALTYCLTLIEDQVWQVSLSAFQSLSIILKQDIDSSSINLFNLLSIFSKVMATTHNSLKNSVIDAFLSLYTLFPTQLGNEQIKQFIDNIMTIQPLPSRLHFLESIAKSKNPFLLNSIKDKLYEAVVSLMGSDQWRIRLGVINVLSTLASIIQDNNLQNNFINLCFQSLSDEATPVRSASSTELARLFLFERNNELTPKCYLDLKNSQTFRKRQSAVTLLHDIYQITNNLEHKQKLIEEISFFNNDSCSNVSQLSQKLLLNLK